MLLHIVPVDVVYDERERVHEGKDKEGIGNPSVEDLESLVRNACEERDPVRFYSPLHYTSSVWREGLVAHEYAQDERHTCQGQPSRPSGQWWRVAIHDV